MAFPLSLAVNHPMDDGEPYGDAPNFTPRWRCAGRYRVVAQRQGMTHTKSALHAGGYLSSRPGHGVKTVALTKSIGMNEKVLTSFLLLAFGLLALLFLQL